MTVLTVFTIIPVVTVVASRVSGDSYCYWQYWPCDVVLAIQSKLGIFGPLAPDLPASETVWRGGGGGVRVEVLEKF